MQHDLKSWPESFQPVRAGEKLFEFRKNDRGFEVSDRLLLREWCHDKEKYTGVEIMVRITHIEHGPKWGIPKGYCVMSILPDIYAPLSLQ